MGVELRVGTARDEMTAGEQLERSIIGRGGLMLRAGGCCCLPCVSVEGPEEGGLGVFWFRVGRSVCVCVNFVGPVSGLVVTCVLFCSVRTVRLWDIRVFNNFYFPCIPLPLGLELQKKYGKRVPCH